MGKSHRLPSRSHKLPTPPETIQVIIIRRLFAGEMVVRPDNYWNKPMLGNAIQQMNIETDNAKKKQKMERRFQIEFDCPMVDFAKQCDCPKLVNRNVGQLMGWDKKPNVNYNVHPFLKMNVCRNR